MTATATPAADTARCANTPAPARRPGPSAAPAGAAANAKPAAEIIDALINPLLKKKVKFVSPALLNQLLPVGVAQTAEQKELVNKKNKPIRNWVQDEKTPENLAGGSGGATSGWNKLNQ